jgi:hypothetical protein
MMTHMFGRAEGLLLGFALVGSVAARMRNLLRPHEVRLAPLQGDLVRVELKLVLAPSFLGAV